MRTKEATARISFSSTASGGIRSRHFLCRLLFAVILVLSVRSAIACKLPVFRYALERWGVDQYRLVALVSDPSQASVRGTRDARGTTSKSMECENRNREPQ